MWRVPRAAWAAAAAAAAAAMAAAAASVALRRSHEPRAPATQRTVGRSVGGPLAWTLAASAAEGGREPPPATAAAAARPLSHAAGLSRYAIADAAARVAPSVVDIQVDVRAAGLLQDGLVARGSGVVIDSGRRLVLTSAHVVSDLRKGSALKAALADGTLVAGRVVGLDADSDLAVVQLDPLPPGVAMPPAARLSSDDALPRAGEWVVAVGSPLSLSQSVTVGVVSAVRRSAEVGARDARLQYLQSDVAIHAGNSGGPLINLEGDVVGINTHRADAYGISFAVCISNARAVIEQLITRGHVVRPYVGMQLLTLSPAVIADLRNLDSFDGNLPPSDSGVLVADVDLHSPASRADLQPGDVIIKVEREPVSTSQQVLARFGFRADGPVEFTVLRREESGGEAMPVDVYVTPIEAPRNGSAQGA